MIQKNKKAFGDAVSTLIMFIAVISVTTGLVIVFKNYVTDTQQSFSTQNKLTSNQLRTSVSITNIYYNITSNVSYIYLKNIGNTKLSTDLFDLFIDNAYQKSFTVYDAQDLTTIQEILNPQETVAIVKSINLTPGSHDVKISTEYGVGDKDSFNI